MHFNKMFVVDASYIDGNWGLQSMETFVVKNLKSWSSNGLLLRSGSPCKQAIIDFL